MKSQSEEIRQKSRFIEKQRKIRKDRTNYEKTTGNNHNRWNHEHKSIG